MKIKTVGNPITTVEKEKAKKKIKAKKAEPVIKKGIDKATVYYWLDKHDIKDSDLLLLVENNEVLNFIANSNLINIKFEALEITIKNKEIKIKQL